MDETVFGFSTAISLLLLICFSFLWGVPFGLIGLQGDRRHLTLEIDIESQFFFTQHLVFFYLSFLFFMFYCHHVNQKIIMIIIIEKTQRVWFSLIKKKYGRWWEDNFCGKKTRCWKDEKKKFCCRAIRRIFFCKF